jgi:uncharacterized membrane protein YhaH (DUF805 family)
MGFFAAIKSVMSQYAGFSGRARRSEYWYWVLFTLLWCWIPLLNILLALIFFIPGLAVAVRRLHDTGRTGWWLLISLVPVIGGIVLLIFYCTDSQIGENEYGPNPKGINPQSAAQAEPAAEPKEPQSEADRWQD